MAVRLYQPADRVATLGFLHRPGAIDSPNTYIHVAEENRRIVGLVQYIAMGGSDALLGPIELADEHRADLFHELLTAAIEHAIGLGYESGFAEVRKPTIMRYVRRVYGVEPEPLATDSITGRVSLWRFQVHLPTTLAMLRGMDMRRG